jgi:hypothetical protein
MNTRKDYWRAVKVIRESTEAGSYDRMKLTHAFEEFFSTDNPRFDSDRFEHAINTEYLKYKIAE